MNISKRNVWIISSSLVIIVVLSFLSLTHTKKNVIQRKVIGTWLWTPEPHFFGTDIPEPEYNQLNIRFEFFSDNTLLLDVWEKNVIELKEDIESIMKGIIKPPQKIIHEKFEVGKSYGQWPVLNDGRVKIVIEEYRSSNQSLNALWNMFIGDSKILFGTFSRLNKESLEIEFPKATRDIGYNGLRYFRGILIKYPTFKDRIQKQLDNYFFNLYF